MWNGNTELDAAGKIWGGFLLQRIEADIRTS